MQTPTARTPRAASRSVVSWSCVQKLYTVPYELSDLGGELEEHEGREDGADAGAHGAADQTKHQLDVWHQNPNDEADQDHSTGYHVEPGENG